MKGYVEEDRPGVWRVFYDLPPDPVTGKRRRRSMRVYGDRQAAEKHLNIILGSVADGDFVDSDPTVNQLADRWLGTVAANVRPTTLDGYGQKLRMVRPLVGHRKAGELTPLILTDLYRRLDCSAQTVVHLHRVLHRMFADAVRWHLVSSNPTEGAVPPRIQRRRLKVWTADQLGVFLERTRSHRCSMLFRLAAATGMRRGELLGLRWANVDLQRGHVDVTETTVMVEGHPVPSLPKTASGRRRVALDGDTLQALRLHRQTQDEARSYFGYTTDWVFCWDDGKPWSPDWASKQFRAAIGGLPKIRFHDLRHTWATLALEAGVPAKVVADRLGHAGIQITLDTYTHHSDSLDRQAAEQVMGLIGAKIGATTRTQTNIIPIRSA